MSLEGRQTYVSWFRGDGDESGSGSGSDGGDGGGGDRHVGAAVTFGEVRTTYLGAGGRRKLILRKSRPLRAAAGENANANEKKKT